MPETYRQMKCRNDTEFHLVLRRIDYHKIFNIAIKKHRLSSTIVYITTTHDFNYKLPGDYSCSPDVIDVACGDKAIDNCFWICFGFTAASVSFGTITIISVSSITSRMLRLARQIGWLRGARRRNGARVRLVCFGIRGIPRYESIPLIGDNRVREIAHRSEFTTRGRNCAHHDRCDRKLISQLVQLKARNCPRTAVIVR